MLFDWEATPDLSRALRREKSKRWSFLRKCDRIGSIFGGIDSTIMESSRRRELLNEVLLVTRGISFQSAAIFLCPKATTQISHGTRTKYRKTRAMLREFSAVACLALKQLRHLAVRVKPISCALRACFLGHYRMARMSQSASPCGLASLMRLSTIYYICDAPASLPFYKKFKHPHTVDEYSHKSNGKKILTVLRRNSIIIVNCSAEDI